MDQRRRLELVTGKNLKPIHWVLIVAGVLFFLLVWPTPYQIYKHPKGPVYRVNRFTGKTEGATSDGWRKAFVHPGGLTY